MKTDRREFLKYGLITTSVFMGSVYGFHQWRNRKMEKPKYTGKLIEQSGRGHQLRSALSKDANASADEAVIIVGGGMSGLMTGYYLKKNGFHNFKIIEMNEQTGGNSSFGENSVSKYPWGAHYIPLPNSENTDLIEFFKDMGVARAVNGKIEFSEEHLCQDPQERLFIRGEWQESILPLKNISAEDQAQLKRFQELVETYKYKKGTDGRFVFSVPVMSSTTDPEFLALDHLSFEDFLKKNKFNSDVVRWYMDYCMLDDYGMGISAVSAWAGLHYFCSRRPLGQYDDHKILTWPEGNGWILKKLEGILKDHIITNQAVMDIKSLGKRQVSCKSFDFETQRITLYHSRALVFSAPQFLSKYLFTDKKHRPQISPDEYYSWLVANVTVKLPQNDWNGLHWDNVRFESKSLGYIHARHQELRGPIDGNTVLTLYWPLYDKTLTATEVRKKISKLTWKDWAPRVVSELELMHPGMGEYIQNVDIKIHGHAMIGPRVGRIRRVFGSALDGKVLDGIFFAHTDNSGMSLFEEAHYWGHQTAKDIIKYVHES